MSMAVHPESKQIVCGVNSAEDALKSGQNQNCRKFAIQDGKYVPVLGCQAPFLKEVVSQACFPGKH